MNDEAPATDQKVLLVVHQHWGALVPEAAAVLTPVLIIFIFLLLAGLSANFGAHLLLAFLAPFGLLVAWIVIMAFWANHHLNMLIVTDSRVYLLAQISMLRRVVLEWDISDILHADVRLGSIFETMLGYGSLFLESRSDHEVTEIPGIGDPEYVSAIILKQDDRYHQLSDTAKKQEELLHFISHEVKGHLTKSKAAFAAIAEGDYGPVSASIGQLARTALADTQAGVDTVMSILDSSDFAHGATKLAHKPFDLSAVVKRSAESFHGAALEKRLELRIDVDKLCAMVGDEEKLEKHVVRNLIDNAIRYTLAGHVAITLRKQDGVARLTVADTGVGISKKDMKNLFKEGGHGERSRTVNPESTGYGLYIAKQLVEAHGGSIWAHSQGEGNGSTFIVELPLAK